MTVKIVIRWAVFFLFFLKKKKSLWEVVENGLARLTKQYTGQKTHDDGKKTGLC